MAGQNNAIAPLNQVVTNRGLSFQIGFNVNDLSYVAQFNEQVKQGLGVTFKKMSLVCMSDYVTSVKHIAFIGFIVIPLQDVTSSIFTPKVTRYANFFVEFMCPASARGNSVWTPQTANLEVLKYMYRAMYEGNGKLFQSFHNVWVPAEVGVIDNRPQHMREMDTAMQSFMTPQEPTVVPAGFTELLNRMCDAAWSEPNSKFRRFFYKYMITNMICVAKMGNFSEAKLDSVSKQIQEANKVSLDISREDMKKLFSALKVIMKDNGVNPVQMMKSNLGIIALEDSMRFSLVMTQSLDVNLTGVTIIADAMAKYPTLRVWNMLHIHCGDQFNKWKTACTIVAQNGFIAFIDGPDKERTRSTLFPDYFYAAQQILVRIGGEDNIKGIQTSVKPNVKSLIDKNIKADIEEMAADSDMEKYRWEAGQSVMTMSTDMPALIGSLTQ